METESLPTEWNYDVGAFQIVVTNNNQKFSMRAINSATGAQYGPQQVFSEISSSIVAECLKKQMRLSEVTDNSIKVQTCLYNNPIALLLQQNSPIEKECNLLRIKVEKLEDRLKAQEGELNQLRNQVGKIHYFQTTVNDWKYYCDTGVVAKIDFSHLNLRNKPHVQVSMNGTGSHWETSGSNCVYNLTSQSFEVYVKWTGGGALNPDIAKKYGWYLSYVIHSLD